MYGFVAVGIHNNHGSRGGPATPGFTCVDPRHECLSSVTDRQTDVSSFLPHQHPEPQLSGPYPVLQCSGSSSGYPAPRSARVTSLLCAVLYTDNTTHLLSVCVSLHKQHNPPPHTPALHVQLFAFSVLNIANHDRQKVNKRC